MSHTSAFPGEFPVADQCLSDPSGTLDECARALAKLPLQAPPGTAFIYSGAGMQIAGRVAEVAAGKDWPTLFGERLAKPLVSRIARPFTVPIANVVEPAARTQNEAVKAFQRQETRHDFYRL